MGGVAGNLVCGCLAFHCERVLWRAARSEASTHLIPQTFASNDGNLIANTLVGLEVQGQFGVVTFDYDFGRFLDCLRANATL